MTALPLPGSSFRARLRAGTILVPVAIGLALAGCAKPQSAVDATVTGAISQPLTPDDFQKALTYWGDRYQREPKNKDVALNYAAALNRIGHSDQAVIVLRQTSGQFPADRDVLAAYGKALASSGDLQTALLVIQRAESSNQPDWKLKSAEAAILDQLGRQDEARKLYAQALQLAPNEPSTLSNFAMSYVLTGELPAAEKLLRQAIASPGADSRVRQNLALVVGLSGRFDEAQKIASAELSPDQAAANIAYLKQMMAEQNSWQKLRGKTTG